MKDILADIKPLLPEDWEEKAKACKALQRKRNIQEPGELLSVNLIYAGVGGSYQATSEITTLSGIALDKTATYRRILASGDWLQYLAEGVCRKAELILPKPAFIGERAFIVADAAELSLPGSTGGDYRLHYAFDLFGFTCRDTLLTPASQGEKLSLHDIKEGDIVEGDRAYGTVTGMEYVRERKADFILRLRRNAFKLYDEAGNEIDILTYTQGMNAYEMREIRCFYQVDREKRPVRIVIMKNDKAAVARSRRRLARNASRKQEKPVSAQTALMNEYMVLSTSLEYKMEQIVELYRSRWQIEMVFLRLKELFGIGKIPNKKPASVKAWFYGKLLLAAICEAEIRLHTFSPSAAIFAQPQHLE